jgi:hypothetical protein
VNGAADDNEEDGPDKGHGAREEVTVALDQGSGGGRGYMGGASGTLFLQHTVWTASPGLVQLWLTLKTDPRAPGKISQNTGDLN